MVTVPGVYLDGAREPHNLYIFANPTKEIPDREHWCYWISLIPSNSYHTAATYGSDRIQLAELIYPCSSFEEALEYFRLHYPEYYV